LLLSPPTHTGKSAARDKGPVLPKIGRHPHVLMAIMQPPDSNERHCSRPALIRGVLVRGGSNNPVVTFPPHPPSQ
jgi:hypothetical protein